MLTGLRRLCSAWSLAWVWLLFSSPAGASVLTFTPPPFYPPVPVLAYHHFVTEGEANPYYWNLTVTTRQFERQLRWLADRGYTSLTVSELQAAVLEGRPLPSQPVVLTVDDGYESLYTRMFPLLLRYRTKATVYLIVSRIGQSRRGLRYLSADQIRRMDQSGLVEFGSHGFDLHWKDLDRTALGRWLPESLAGRPAAELLPLEQVEEDLAQSKRRLEAILGHPVTSFALPFGHPNPRLEAAARQVGFTSVAVVGNGLPAQTPYALLDRRYVQGYHALGYFGEELLAPVRRRKAPAGLRISFLWF